MLVMAHILRGVSDSVFRFSTILAPPASGNLPQMRIAPLHHFAQGTACMYVHTFVPSWLKFPATYDKINATALMEI
jgi:hypothetical protein